MLKLIIIIIVLSFISYLGYTTINNQQPKQLKSLQDLETKINKGEKVYVVAGCLYECNDLIQANKDTYQQLLPLADFINQFKVIDLTTKEIHDNQPTIQKIFNNNLSEIKLYLFEDTKLQSSINLLDQNQKPQTDIIIEYFKQTKANDQIISLIDKYLKQ